MIKFPGKMFYLIQVDPRWVFSKNSSNHIFGFFVTDLEAFDCFTEQPIKTLKLLGKITKKAEVHYDSE